MYNWCTKFKDHLEEAFSLPFEVIQSIIDGEIHYICSPQNEGGLLFNVSIHIHNQIRLIVNIEPQTFGRNILNEMSQATPSQRKYFFEYIDLIKDNGASVQFKVNDIALLQSNIWINKWESFICKITKVPIDINTDEDAFGIICEWFQHAFNLIFSLLTIIDNNDELIESKIKDEGRKYQILSTRYERNPINRKLCLHKKGYQCSVCKVNLEDVYGDIGRNYIEVHHATPVSLMDENYVLDIDRDLYPLCPNCHAMIHRKNPPYAINELIAYIKP